MKIESDSLDELLVALGRYNIRKSNIILAESTKEHKYYVLNSGVILTDIRDFTISTQSSGIEVVLMSRHGYTHEWISAERTEVTDMHDVVEEVFGCNVALLGYIIDRGKTVPVYYTQQLARGFGGFVMQLLLDRFRDKIDLIDINNIKYHAGISYLKRMEVL